MKIKARDKNTLRQYFMGSGGSRNPGIPGTISWIV